MAAGKNIRAGAAYVQLYADSSKLDAALASMGRKFTALGNMIGGWGQRLAAAGAAIVAPIAMASKGFADYGSKIHDLAQQTGISTEALSGLGYAASQAGSTLEAVVGAVGKMQKNLSEMSDESKQVQDAVTGLGLKLEDLRSLAPEEQFKRIAEAISKLPRATDRTAAAMAIFGRSGAALLPMMSEGAAGLEKMQKRAQELGLVMSGKTAAAADELGDSMADLTLAIKGAWMAIGEAVSPVILTIVQHITDAVVSVRKFIAENQDLVIKALLVGSAIAVAGAILFAFGQAIVFGVGVVTALGSILATVWAAIASTWGAIMAVVGSPILLTIAALAAFGAAALYYSGYVGKAFEWLSGRFTSLKNFASDALGGIADALKGGDIKLAAQILWKTLEVAWRTGVNALYGIWNNFKNIVLQVFHSVTHGVAAAWHTLIHSLKIAWVEFSAWFKKLQFEDARHMIWAQAQQDVKEQFGDGPLSKDKAARINKFYGGNVQEGQTLTPEQLADLAVKEFRKREEAHTRDTKAERGAIDKERDDQINAFDKTFSEKMAKIGDSYNKKIDAAAADLAKKQAAGAEELAKLWAEFSALIAKAKRAREMKEQQLATSSPPAMAALGVSAAMGKTASFGSFSAAAANIGARLGTDKTLDAIKKATEDTAKNTRALTSLFDPSKAIPGSTYGR